MARDARDDEVAVALRELARDLRGPLLALDTSGPTGVLCMVGWREDEVVEHALTSRAMPSEALSTRLASSLEETGLALGTLRAVVVGNGPGSFTGLRVGLSLAKGLALGADVPLVGVSSLATLALSAGPGRVVALRDARRGEVFAGAYEVSATAATAVMDDCCMTMSMLAARLTELGGVSRLITDDVEMAPGLAVLGTIPVTSVVPRGGPLVLLAAERLRRADYDTLDTLVPRYLRLSEPERVAAP
ncbi:MAG: tRNA (adenosine(37)-N6)-threonylcarbamoyltransferase complex dimerization subunit type 1 TsaB [Myxococcota bacterium]